MADIANVPPGPDSGALHLDGRCRLVGSPRNQWPPMSKGPDMTARVVKSDCFGLGLPVAPLKRTRVSKHSLRIACVCVYVAALARSCCQP